MLVAGVIMINIILALSLNGMIFEKELYLVRASNSALENQEQLPECKSKPR
jgi:hypothetical protein